MRPGRRVRFVNRVAPPPLDARRAVDDPQGGPGRITGGPAAGRLHDQRGVAVSVAPAVAIEIDRAVGDDGADLGREQWAKPSADQLGLADHRVGVDPVRAGDEPGLVAIVAQTPGEKAGVVAAAPPVDDAVRGARRGVAPARSRDVAALAYEGARPAHGPVRW